MSLARKTSLLGLISLLLASSMLAPSAAVPTVDLETVERQVNQLQSEAASAAEDWNAAREKLNSVKSRIASLQRRATAQAAQKDDLSKDLAGIIRTLYKSGAIDLDIQAMMAADPAAFISHLEAINVVGSRQQATIRRLAAANVNMATTRAALRAEKAKAAKIAAEARRHLQTANDKLAAAEKLLSSLQEADRKRRAARIAAQQRKQALEAKKQAKKVTNVAVSARIKKVLKYALAQVGDKYSMGGTGPTYYDCSGLTMMAYRQIGVSLSHFSGSQWSQTRRVSRSELRPGDLIFYFRGIRHVTMYIGNGKMVHASNYGTGVIISSINESYYTARLSGYGRVIG